MPGIFINYRRDSEWGIAGRLYDRLAQELPSERLFMDVHDLPPGVNFTDHIDATLRDCTVLLALIGSKWLDTRDDKGRRRLDLEDDFVRIEIAVALRLGKRVIPVLIGNASMPSADELPSSMKPLAVRHAAHLTYEGFADDCGRLIGALRDSMPEPPRKGFFSWFGGGRGSSTRRRRPWISITISVSLALALGAGLLLAYPGFPILVPKGAADERQVAEAKRQQEALAAKRKADEEAAAAQRQADGFAYGLALSDYARGDYASTLRVILPLATRGDARAQILLGEMYEQGAGVNKDYSQASSWFRKAAEQGHATAQRKLGELYMDGLGVPKDVREALAWYRKAAERGSPIAQYKLGALYENGRGVALDYAQAETWYRKAADQGNVDAQLRLGVMYQEGRGVPKDDSQAMIWYQKAATAGSADAAKRLRDLSKSGRTP